MFQKKGIASEKVETDSVTTTLQHIRGNGAAFYGKLLDDFTTSYKSPSLVIFFKLLPQDETETEKV